VPHSLIHTHTHTLGPADGGTEKMNRCGRRRPAEPLAPFPSESEAVSTTWIEIFLITIRAIVTAIGRDVPHSPGS